MVSMLLSLAGCALLLHTVAATRSEDEVSLLSTQVSLHRRTPGSGPGPQAPGVAGAGTPVAAGLPLLQEGGVGRRVRTVPAVTIDLELPPRERWQPYYRAHREEILAQKADKIAEIPVEMAGTTWFDDLGFDGYEDYLEELRGVAEAMDHPNITLQSLLWGEFSYERGETLGCTAVLAANTNGSVFHGRNLDLKEGASKVPDLLDVTYVRGGRPLIVATLFIGTVGVSTGYRVGSYSVAQNTRHGCQDQTRNQAAARSGGQIFSIVVRKMLEEVPDFATAVQTMATTEFVAPHYFTLAGSGPYEGALVTRDRRGSPEPYGNVQVLSPQIGRYFLAQTNDDIAHPPMDPRRGVAVARLEQLRQEDVDEDAVLSVMQAVPVLNLGTVFTWVIEPATGKRRMLIGKDELLADISQVLPPFTLEWFEG